MPLKLGHGWWMCNYISHELWDGLLIHVSDKPREQKNGLVQEGRNSIADALELRLSCTNPSKWLLATSLTYYRVPL